METIKVKLQNKDLVVLDEDGKQIPYDSGGVEVKKTIHIIRAIKSGDLVEVAPSKKAKKKEEGGN